MSDLILASSSLGRKKLLGYLKIPFKIIKSHLDEEKIIGKNPLDTLRLRARLKAEKVAGDLNGGPHTVLSADSGAIIDNELIGKPVNRHQAVTILKKLSGRTHRFITWVHIIKIDNNKSKSKEIIYSGETRSQVTFRKITDEEIEKYLDLTDHLRYAGSYALISAQNFITRVEGSLTNVIGLPFEVILPLLGTVL